MICHYAFKLLFFLILNINGIVFPWGLCRNQLPRIKVFDHPSIQCFDGNDLIENNFNPQRSKRWNSMTNCSFANNFIELDLLHPKPHFLSHFVNSCYPLTPQAFQRSLKSPINHDMRLLNLIKTILLGKQHEIKIVTIGGSVAAGNKAGGRSASSSSLFVHWLQRKYPKTFFIHFHLAVPATDSFWRLANMQSVFEFNPDLVIYDYSSNDISASSSFSESKFRTITESIIRSLYSSSSSSNQIQKSISVIQLVLLRTLDPTNEIAGDSAQFNVIEQIAEFYQYTLVSYRDAIWPIHNKPPPKKSGVFDSEWVHPTWYVHQLIADTLAYAWTNTEHLLLRFASQSALSSSETSTSIHEKLLNTDITIPSLPPAQYLDDSVEALKSCASGFDSSYERHSWPYPLSTSWVFVNTSMKEGWQFVIGDSKLSPPPPPSSSSSLSSQSPPRLFNAQEDKEFSNTDDLFELMNTSTVRSLSIITQNNNKFVTNLLENRSPKEIRRKTKFKTKSIRKRRRKLVQHIKTLSSHRIRNNGNTEKEIEHKLQRENDHDLNQLHKNDYNRDNDSDEEDDFLDIDDFLDHDEIIKLINTTHFQQTHSKLFNIISSSCGHYQGIEFEMHFQSKQRMNQNPTLLIFYLKSYNQFGRAIVIIDSNEDEITSILKTQYHYFQICLAHYIKINQHSFLRNINNVSSSSTSSSSSSKLIQARICNQMLSGDYDEPFVLNGHWSDHSSQTSVTVFNAQYSLHKDPFLFNTPVYMPNYSKPLVSSAGKHNITIALLKEGVYCHHHQHHHSNYFKTTEHEKNYSKFKILGIKSC